MSINTLWRRLIRRPLVLAIIVAFAALAGWAGWSTTHGEAESRTSVLVVPPWYVEDVSVPNPMLNLTDRTTALASALVVALQADDTARYVAAGGATAYTATNIRDNLRYPEPTSVIQFDVTAPDVSSAHAGAQRLIDQTTQILTKMQTDAAVGQDTNMAKLQVIVPPQESMPAVAKQQVRAAAVFALATFLAGLLFYWGVEGILARRTRLKTSGPDRTEPLHDGAAASHEGLDRVLLNGHAGGDLANHSER